MSGKDTAEVLHGRSRESTARIMQVVRFATVRALRRMEPPEVAVAGVKTEHLAAREHADAIEDATEVVPQAREEMEARR